MKFNQPMSPDIMKRSFGYVLPLLFGIVWGLIGCASLEPPNGGPVDTTTPQIVSVYPDSNARNFNDHQIRLGFDRYVDERSVEESIFISPHIGDLEFDWSGKDVSISFSEKLRHNTTYVVNIGTDVRDRFRNQKRMAQAASLAFSTGPDIDRGVIQGNVFPIKEGDALSGVMIFAYQLNGINPDTLNPITLRPDFITQTGKNGEFFLNHLPFGEFRIFAVRDEYRNLLYDREVDEYGVPSSSINITTEDSLRTDIFMKLTKEDTTGPRLINVTSLDRNHIVAEFSESVNPSSLSGLSFVIMDTIDKKPLDLLNVNPLSSTAAACVVVSRDQDSTKVYQFHVMNITDSVGNPINPLARSLLFRGSSKIDTTRPHIASVSIKDSAQAVDLQPQLTLTFSDALTMTGPLDWVNILDNNKQSIPTETKKISDFMISIRPKTELKSRTWYVLRADMQKLHDWAGRVCRDSVKMWRFETLDIEDMSSVEGTVTDINTSDTAGRVYVTASSISLKTPQRYTVCAETVGKFIFPQLVEGQYVFQAFRDRNRNGRYDGGEPFPFVYSERLSSFSDTLKVRARWPLEDVQIRIK